MRVRPFVPGDSFAGLVVGDDGDPRSVPEVASANDQSSPVGRPELGGRRPFGETPIEVFLAVICQRTQAVGARVVGNRIPEAVTILEPVRFDFTSDDVGVEVELAANHLVAHTGFFRGE